MGTRVPSKIQIIGQPGEKTEGPSIPGRERLKAAKNLGCLPNKKSVTGA